MKSKNIPLVFLVESYAVYPLLTMLDALGAARLNPDIFTQGLIMMFNILKKIYVLPIVLVLTSCLPPLYATGGYNNLPGSYDVAYIIQPITFNVGAFINQCWRSKYYSDELHDTMLSAYLAEHEKLTGVKPVVTDYEQYVDYSICKRLVYNFVNPGYIPSVNKNEEKWYDKPDSRSWVLIK